MTAKGPNREFPQFIQGVGQRLEYYRDVARLTLNELAAASGVDRTTIRAIELGRRNPSMKLVWKLAQSLQVEFKELIPPPPVDVLGGKGGPAR